MPNNNPIPNLFALLADEQTPIRRIPLNNEFQQELGEFFGRQKKEFFEGKEIREFTESYNVDSSEIFKIKAYPLSKTISDALRNPLSTSILNLKTETSRIKALFTGGWEDQEKYVNFQSSNRGKLLSKGWTLIGSGNSYKKLQDPGLILQDELAAHYSDGNLFFSSYGSATRFLQLSEYYKAASNIDLDAFAKNKLFKLEDPDSFKLNADLTIRRKVALIQKNRVLDGLEIGKVEAVITDLNQNVKETNKIIIDIEESQIIIPKDKKRLKELIRFLDEDYVTTDLTGSRCLTNSKQYL